MGVVPSVLDFLGLDGAQQNEFAIAKFELDCAECFVTFGCVEDAAYPLQEFGAVH
jgi:hypothetical protein